MELLINSTEQMQPQERNDTVIVLYGRRPEDPEVRYRVNVFGFRPYFYVREDEARADETYLLSQECIEEIDYIGYDAFLEDEDLAKVYTPYPQHVGEAKDFFDDHWNADIPFTDRFRIDTGVKDVVEVPEPDGESAEIDCHWREIRPVEGGPRDATPTPQGGKDRFQNVDPRITTLDIEVDDRGDGFPAHGDERILSIVAHDSLTDETVGFLDLNGRAIEDALPNGAPENIDEVHVQDSERKMLIDFRTWFQQADPDIVTGWNSDDFDIPFIIERMNRIEGLNPNVLSPLGWAGVTRRGDPRIKGRVCYDLLEVYKANSFTELRSYKLDDVAEEELDEAKVEFTGSYYDLYQNDTEKFLKYNAHDVNLTAGINREAGVIDFRDALRREVGVDFEDSYNANDFIEMLCRRALKEREMAGPTASYDGDDDYEGAHVLDAHTGVEENVVGIDLSSLYPYTMAMLNASPETKCDPDDEGAALAANEVAFCLDEDGLFKELVDDALSLKSEYKERRNEAETDEEYERWSKKYLTAKTITNSIYGVTGWERFFLYDEDVAAAVTLTGQKVIKRTAEFVDNAGHNVIYGDTDSTYVSMPDELSMEECLDTARELCDELNEEIYPTLAASMGIPPEDNLWDIEVEAYMARFFQAGKKKRYAYLALWKDGREVDDPKPTIKGFASRRSDTAELTVETEKSIFEEILHGDPENAAQYVFEAAKEITDEAPDWDRIGIPGGMNNKIDPAHAGEDGYYAFHDDGYPQGAHPRAVWNANKILNLDLGSGDKPKRVYLEPKVFDDVARQINVIAFESGADMEPIEGSARVDVSRMIDTLLISPLGNILEAIDIDPRAAVRGQQQTGLGAFS